MRSLPVIINTTAVPELNTRRRIRLAPGETELPTPAARTAEKMVIACRENVRFLNEYLKHYRRYLELPPVIVNILYLAYSIKVKDNAPFSADELCRHLRQQGIETSPEFHFTSVASNDNCDFPGDTPAEVSSPVHSGKFCIPCHLGVTILDLNHTIRAFDSFFQTIENKQGLKKNS